MKYRLVLCLAAIIALGADGCDVDDPGSWSCTAPDHEDNRVPLGDPTYTLTYEGIGGEKHCAGSIDVYDDNGKLNTTALIDGFDVACLERVDQLDEADRKLIGFGGVKVIVISEASKEERMDRNFFVKSVSEVVKYARELMSEQP